MTTTQDTTAAAPRLSEAIRAASLAAHGQAERSPFMNDLFASRVDQRRYANLVAQLYYVYGVLERAADTMRTHPQVAPFTRSELTRLPAIQADLQFLLGDDWATQIAPTAATGAYCDRLLEIGFTWPAGLVAHHYVRYMGDLSGGQIIRGIVQRAFKWPGSDGTRFYVFDDIDDLDAFKQRYRQQLDRAPWDVEEQQRLIDEVLLAYRLNTRVLAELP